MVSLVVEGSNIHQVLARNSPTPQTTKTIHPDRYLGSPGPGELPLWKLSIVYIAIHHADERVKGLPNMLRLQGDP